jgi:hypothetical protein
VTVRNYGPTAQAVTPASTSEVQVTYMDGTVPTFSTPVALDGSGNVSFAIDDGGTPPIRLLVKVVKPNGGSSSTARVNLGPDGTAPTATTGAAAGTAPSAITVSGHDDDGTISLTTGTATAAGKVATVTFATAKAAPPDGIVISADNDVASAAGLQVRNVTAAGFEVWARTAPTASSALVCSYAYVPTSAGA